MNPFLPKFFFVALVFSVFPAFRAVAKEIISENPPQVISNADGRVLLEFTWKNSGSRDTCVVWPGFVSIYEADTRKLVPKKWEGSVIGDVVGAFSLRDIKSGFLKVYDLPGKKSLRVQYLLEIESLVEDDLLSNPKMEYVARSSLYQIECWRADQKKQISTLEFGSLTGKRTSKVSRPTLSKPSEPFVFSFPRQ